MPKNLQYRSRMIFDIAWSGVVCKFQLKKMLARNRYVSIGTPALGGAHAESYDPRRLDREEGVAAAGREAGGLRGGEGAHALLRCLGPTTRSCGAVRAVRALGSWGEPWGLRCRKPEGFLGYQETVLECAGFCPSVWDGFI